MKDSLGYKCRGIIEELQAEVPFLAIRDKKIHVFTADFKERPENAYSLWIPGVLRYITVNEKLDNLDDEVLEALIAHELGHHESYANMSFVEYTTLMRRLVCRAKISAALRNQQEHYADQMAIEAGCTNGLLKLTHMNQMNTERNDHEFYMSTDEIKQYAAKIGDSTSYRRMRKTAKIRNK